MMALNVPAIRAAFFHPPIAFQVAMGVSFLTLVALVSRGSFCDGSVD